MSEIEAPSRRGDLAWLERELKLGALSMPMFLKVFGGDVFGLCDAVLDCRLPEPLLLEAWMSMGPVLTARMFMRAAYTMRVSQLSP